MRRSLWLVASMVVIAACATAGDTSEDAAGTSQQQPASARQAPDFSLELGDGGTFTLSEETRPVFMVFWAEW